MKRKVKKIYLIVITLLTLVVCTIGAIMNTSFLFGSFHDKIESWSSNGNISISNEADLDSFKDIPGTAFTTPPATHQKLRCR